MTDLKAYYESDGGSYWDGNTKRQCAKTHYVVIHNERTGDRERIDLDSDHECRAFVGGFNRAKVLLERERGRIDAQLEAALEVVNTHPKTVDGAVIIVGMTVWQFQPFIDTEESDIRDMLVTSISKDACKCWPCEPDIETLYSSKASALKAMETFNASR